MATTFDEMRDLVDELLNEDPDTTARDNAINDAVGSLWLALAKANPQKYLYQKPDKLTADDDEIPFDDLGPDGYVKYSAAQLLCLKIYEYDAAASWAEQAGIELEGIISIALLSKDRQETITPFQTSP